MNRHRYGGGKIYTTDKMKEGIYKGIQVLSVAEFDPKYLYVYEAIISRNMSQRLLCHVLHYIKVNEYRKGV